MRDDPVGSDPAEAWTVPTNKSARGVRLRSSGLRAVISGSMKAMAAVFLVLLLLLVALPLGMGDMGDCPACTFTKSPFELGLCAAVLLLLVLAAFLSGFRFRIAAKASFRLLVPRSIYRPPRFA